MKLLRDAMLLGIVVAVSASYGQDVLDRVAEKLTVANRAGTIAARVSGTLDTEAYFFAHPAPGLIYAPGHALFNPRLSLFVDAQLGPRVYAFGQARVDRGFDPAEAHVRMRLDEYAVRLAAREDGRLSIQVGQFATVVGRWASRHGSWENAFVTAPLAYGNLTGIWDSTAVRSTEVLLSWAHLRPSASAPDEYSDKHLRVPIIWGPSYTTGAAVFGAIGKFDYAAELKNAALSSRPESWNLDRHAWKRPTVSARFGYRPSLRWTLGWSASTGTYLHPTAVAIPAGYGLGDYRQTVLMQDIGFAWRHWQVWAEFAHAHFEIPRVGLADTSTGFIEAKYKVTPRFTGAIRLNRQTFGELTDSRGRRVAWGRDLWQVDVAPAFRFTEHLQAKLQYSFQRAEATARRTTHTLATQLTVRF